MQGDFEFAVIAPDGSNAPFDVHYVCPIADERNVLGRCDMIIHPEHLLILGVCKSLQVGQLWVTLHTPSCAPPSMRGAELPTALYASANGWEGAWHAKFPPGLIADEAY